MSHIVDDVYNPAGPTATPIITSNITILAYGATLERVGSKNFRLFTVGNTGHLTIRRAYIRGFRAQGGKNGNDGGGGGLGAGGAIFVIGGTLVIEASTFQANGALGGEAEGAWVTGAAAAALAGTAGLGLSDCQWWRGRRWWRCPRQRRRRRRSVYPGGGGGGTVSKWTRLGGLVEGGFDCGLGGGWR